MGPGTAISTKLLFHDLPYEIDYYSNLTNLGALLMRVCTEHVGEVGRQSEEGTHLLSSGGVRGRDSSPRDLLSAPLAASVPGVESYHVMLSRICKYLAPKLGKFLFQKARNFH
jgi:hypothetical protein